MSDFDPVDFAALEAQQEQALAQAATRNAAEADDLKWLMADPRGVRFMRRLLERSGVFRSSFTGDPHSTAFREGERNIGLGLIALVSEDCPERLAALMTKGQYDRPCDE